MGRGSRGRRRGRRKSKAARSKRSSASSSSSSKSSKSKSKRRSTAASKRRKVRSVAKAARAAKRTASTSTSSSTSSSSKNKTKRKPKKLKLNKKDKQRQAQENAKKAFKKKNEQKKKTISAAQSRRQVRQKTKEKIATRKKINMPSLGQIGRFTRNIRQPMSMLSDAGVRSALGNPAQAIAQGLANSPHTSDFNKRTRDFSKLTPQQRRRYERLSEKTGRDYSIRNPTFRLNLGVDTLAKFGGFADNKLYRSLPKSIRSLKVDKQFYGNPMKKGWHSSQRTGRGQGISDMQYIPDRYKDARPMPIDTEQIPPEFGKGIRQPDMGPQQDWLSSLYTSHNISGGKLDQGARDYWTNEAKTKGRDAVMQSIIGTSKAQGTYGGKKKPQRINTGSKRRGGGGGHWGLAAALAGKSILRGHVDRKGAKRKAKNKTKELKKRNMKSIASHMGAILGGVG